MDCGLMPVPIAFAANEAMPLLAHGSLREVKRARQPVERILRHIQEGFTRAASRD